MHAPLTFTWDGDAMIPLDRFKRLADKQYVVGETYPLEVAHQRSRASHNHEFAWLADAWNTLPERYRHEPWAQSSEHLRKYALIRTGFCDTQTFACGSKAEAQRWAANLRPMDEYSLVVVSGTTVQRFTAQSQSMRAMGAKRFQESKQALIDYIATLLETTAEAMTGGRAPPLAPEAREERERETAR